jgi:WGR domain
MIERDLFGRTVLVRHWGRIGTRGREACGLACGLSVNSIRQPAAGLHRPHGRLYLSDHAVSSTSEGGRRTFPVALQPGTSELHSGPLHHLYLRH